MFTDIKDLVFGIKHVVDIKLQNIIVPIDP